MERKKSNYYEARGFSIYYFANAVFNIVSSPGAYLRGIEDILGDMKAEFLMRPFKKYTNLHEFVRCVSTDVITESVGYDEINSQFLTNFLKAYSVKHSKSAFENEDTFWSFAVESERFHDAIDEITEEVFHVLFNDMIFLEKFNHLCAGYIELSGFGDEFKTRSESLKRKNIPMWARRAVFHRDRGECRSCKRDLSGIITNLNHARYDHIVALARHGANDITNLQLLCEKCNLEKSARNVTVSAMYQRLIPSE